MTLYCNCPDCGDILRKIDKPEDEKEFIKEYCKTCKKDVLFELDKKYVGYTKKVGEKEK